MFDRSQRALRLLLFILVCMGAWAMPFGTAQAAVTCTADVPDFTFTNVDLVNQTGDLTLTANLTYECRNSSSDKTYVALCFNIGDGDESDGAVNPRLMKSTSGASLQFQLYQPGNVIWGSDVFGGFSSAKATMTTQDKVAHRGTIVMTAKVPAGQGAAAGAITYQDNFAGGHTMMSVGISTTNPNVACGTTSAGSFPFLVSATPVKSCKASATAMEFGSVSGLSATYADSTSTVTVTCSTGVAYNVGLGPSNGNSSGLGAMSATGAIPSNADKVPYQLYRDAARTNNFWGKTIGTNTVTRTSTAAPWPFTVYGRVPSAKFTPDNYLDTVTVTVTY